MPVKKPSIPQVRPQDTLKMTAEQAQAHRLQTAAAYRQQATAGNHSHYMGRCQRCGI